MRRTSVVRLGANRLTHPLGSRQAGGLRAFGANPPYALPCTILRSQFVRHSRMTLVVGYADENIGFLVADSLLTPAMPHMVGQGPVAGEFHGLKIQIVDPNIAIAFAAGDSRSALDVIHSLKFEEKNEDIAYRLLEDYRRAHSKTPFDCEFLILQIKEGQKNACSCDTRGSPKLSTRVFGRPIWIQTAQDFA